MRAARPMTPCFGHSSVGTFLGHAARSFIRRSKKCKESARRRRFV
jgi:hypothetical protein